MTPDAAVQLIRDALMVAFWLCVPALAAGFAASVVVSLLQIVTSIQDMTFNTVPRLAAVLVAIIVAMPWMLQKSMTYMVALLGDFSRYAH